MAAASPLARIPSIPWSSSGTSAWPLTCDKGPHLAEGPPVPRPIVLVREWDDLIVKHLDVYLTVPINSDWFENGAICSDQAK